MKSAYINVKCGIYDTCYKLRDYGYKICVTAPYIRWTGNTGILAFDKVTVKDESQMEYLRYFYGESTFIHDDGTTMDNILYGRY